jgi:hypothetical protein
MRPRSGAGKDPAQSRRDSHGFPADTSVLAHKHAAILRRVYDAVSDGCKLPDTPAGAATRDLIDAYNDQTRRDQAGRLRKVTPSGTA